MGDRLGPSGLLKASLNELNQQQIHQDVEYHVIRKKVVCTPGIEAFNLLLGNPKQAVGGISQAGDDIVIFIQALIDTPGIDIYIRVCFF
jgi:hypothetical protein